MLRDDAISVEKIVELNLPNSCRAAIEAIAGKAVQIHSPHFYQWCQELPIWGLDLAICSGCCWTSTKSLAIL